MRVALVAPPYLTVPPQGYGGIEQVVSLLADGLTARGHDVTLFASGGSQTDARLTSPLEEAPGETALADQYHALAHVIDVYLDEREFDVVHDHTPHGAALAVAAGRGPVVHTLHGPWTDSARAFYGRVHDRIHLVAISETQMNANAEVAYAGVVPNGIDVSTHPFRDDKDDYLVFVGRCTPDKGPEVAVDVARRVGRRLVMVLKRSEPHERRHWERVVAPRLTGTETVLEDLAHDQLTSVMAGAESMVFPIQWAEPFGLVMVEAMACGTPVITRPLGAAQEIVVDEVTGFLRNSVDELVDAVRLARDLSPAACRKIVVERYSAEAMVEGYEAVYRAVGRSPASGIAG